MRPLNAWNWKCVFSRAVDKDITDKFYEFQNILFFRWFIIFEMTKKDQKRSVIMEITTNVNVTGNERRKKQLTSNNKDKAPVWCVNDLIHLRFSHFTIYLDRFDAYTCPSISFAQTHRLLLVSFWLQEFTDNDPLHWTQPK